MEIENRKSTFIRDLVVRVLLIVLFIFLLMFLFPMPNLTPFYDSIFNNNVQSMKDAAEKWYTTDRMPEEVGDTSKLTLQDMLDKKLILPFVDKDGNSCDADRSYVTVKKTEDEYIMKVSLTCGSKTDYIIEHIGCYNFCKDGKCTEEVAKVETEEKTGETVVKNPTPVPTSKHQYKTQYEYEINRLNEKWTLGDWTDQKLEDTVDRKLVNTRTKYIGEKEVSKDTVLYKHLQFKMVDNWTYDTEWTDEVKTITDKLKLYKYVDLYTGQKEVREDIHHYLYETRIVKDSEEIIDWSTQARTTNNSVKLIGTRYTVRISGMKNNTQGKWSAWKKDTTWYSSKPSNTLGKQWGDAYNSKTVSNSTWSEWKAESTFRTSKPANTSTTQYGAIVETKVISPSSSTWVLTDSSFKSRTPLSAYSSDGNKKYVLNSSAFETCTSACNGQSQIRVYYYKVYTKSNTNAKYAYRYQYRTLLTNNSKQYQYLYRTYTESTLGENFSDEQVVTDPKPYVDKGYTIVKIEYKYSVKHLKGEIYRQASDVILPETENRKLIQTSTTTRIKYEDLGKWVSNKAKLGEYTHNIQTKRKYKYMYNNPQRKLVDTVETESITAPAGYEYSNFFRKVQGNKEYIRLDHYVDSIKELGEYNKNITSKTEYQYKYRTTSNYHTSDWFDSNPGGEWKPTGRTRTIQIR